MSVNPTFLETVTAFAQLPEKELIRVSRAFKQHRYRRNDLIFCEDDTGKYAYVVKEGRVKVSRILPSGKETILAFHETGEYFGEMSLIDGKTAPATVTAIVPSTILSIGRSEFSKLLDNPIISRRYSRCCVNDVAMPGRRSRS